MTLRLTISPRSVPVEFLMECFEYQSDGSLLRKVRPLSHFKSAGSHKKYNKKYAGSIVRSKNEDGYLIARVSWDGRFCKLLASHVVWVLHNQAWPLHEIDHINRIRTDNRIENLRDVPRILNIRNSGVRCTTKLATGVQARHGKFRATTFFGGRRVTFGTFERIEDAIVAYETGSMRLRGFIPGKAVL